MQLARVVDRVNPCLSFSARQEMALTLLEEAVAEKQSRATVELVGTARDRRTFNRMQEVLDAVNCKTLMCVI